MAPIRILEKDNNRRGDLFGRLMADLFVALGYEQPRLNVHKSGREVDLTANHRLEPRRAIGECKATAKPIGGDDTNKFVGVLDAENSDDEHPVTGYFISLGGFKETAVEQQKRRRTKFVTLSAPEVINELIEGRILVAGERAAETAGRLCAGLDDLVLDPEAELLAHQRGWIWAIYYTQGKARTHFALVHADGTPLARALADEVIAADLRCGGALQWLTCLNPAPRAGSENDPALADALAGYAQYIAAECGYIQLDGLPTDNDVGSRRLRLENLFVPLHLDIKEGDTVEERQAFGAVLKSNPRLALLAAPGGGKSTLLKRLAVAYADPARRSQIQDDLPDRDWLPLFFRCRELRGLARASFAELLEALSRREGVRQHAGSFLAHVDRALLAGRVLLLVDGLDEISDPGDRAAFVSTLRTALQAYPGVGLVVTSREAGFRHVAAHLTPVCALATLSPFNGEDIRRLSVAWHSEVVADSDKVRADAQQLADTIAENHRIRLLAVNPLLLTTLLLVRRWVGQLPTRRAVLYGEAVKVLTRTWNTEGHDPLPEEETLPQLCYVAAAMMLEGIQKISRPRLAVLLQEARDALPTELGYVKGTVDEFIHRVEDRSSLLMMSGYDVEDGRLVEFFEFRHLTFQEFLTARGMVEGWHPNRRDNDSLTTSLLPHIEKEEWSEVIPLAAVLGGKATEGLIQALTFALAGDRLENPSIATALNMCLADEAAARPETIRAAIRQLLRKMNVTVDVHYAKIAKSRYGPELKNEARMAITSPNYSVQAAGAALLEVVWWESVTEVGSQNYSGLVKRFAEWLSNSDPVVQCEGALGCLELCFRLHDSKALLKKNIRNTIASIGPRLLPLLFSEDIPRQYASTFALTWLGQCQVWIPPAVPDVLGRLFTLARTGNHPEIRRLAEWALTSQPLTERTDAHRFESVDPIELENVIRSDPNSVDVDPLFRVVAAWYGKALDDKELAQCSEALMGSYGRDEERRRILKQLLKALGVSTKLP
jgi:hypothetical protein